MYRGGARGYRGRGGSRSSRGGGPLNTSRTLKGLFADGVWHCECTPSLPAEHFKVKKEGKNHGKWFYTCQNTEPKRCGFFLWDEDAKPREEAAVLSNSRTEPMARQSGGREAQEGWDAGRAARAARTDAMGARGRVVGRGLFAQQQRQDVHVVPIVDNGEETESPSPQAKSPAPPYTTVPGSSSGKRNAGQAGLDDDEDDFFPWPLTGQEEQELVQPAGALGAPQTPHKALKTGVYATPATTAKRKLPWLEQEQAPGTPATPRGPNLHGKADVDTPSRSTDIAAQYTLAQNETTPQAQSTHHINSTTPSPPTRYKDALSNPSDSNGSLTYEVLSILESATLNPDTLSALRSTLTRHDLKTQGVTKGRELSRLAVKAKEAKIAELEAKSAAVENARISELRHRIASLEAEREVDRGIIGHLKWKLSQGGKDGGEDSQETIV
ncbi:hypothetical protein LTR62_005006 [Meristemomyces frigidus]|uniref:GRF-type domain-containing protein n=1 Tax=Meristemomyces frigidus TaxID=1508187 RepID=A0AAN7TWD7_9PEZI|nr:hypothetical protein LTR62_005006 [Meristemomyces frigidus]